MNHIKIIHKILSLYHYHIFRSSFGDGIFKGKPLPLYEPEWIKLFPKIWNFMKEVSDVGEQAASSLGTGTSQKVHVSLICLHIQWQIYIQTT